jgi:hypothetical protein
VRLTVVLLAAALALVACSWTETDRRMAADATAPDAPGGHAVAGPDTANPSPPAAEPSSLMAAASAPAASAVPSAPPASPAPPVAPDPAAVQRVVDAAAAEAAAMDVEQAVAVVDRDTGQMVAAVSGDAQFNSESVTKLFTVAYYLLQSNGVPGAALAADLRSLIVQSSDGPQFALWEPDIVSSIADRYGLTGTTISARESPRTWGSDRVTARDAATFMYAASRDPLVGPLLMEWMSATAERGEDGFDQQFGLNALVGDHGSKQGWSDPGWLPANLHSVGWAERYFVAILQSSPSAPYATMRATSTATASRIAAGV